MNASLHRQTGRQQKGRRDEAGRQTERRGERKKETGGRMDVETGTDRQTCKLTDSH